MQVMINGAISKKEGDLYPLTCGFDFQGFVDGKDVLATPLGTVVEAAILSKIQPLEFPSGPIVIEISIKVMNGR